MNSPIAITREDAPASPRELDAELKKRNWHGLLHGIPIALKDNIDTAGIRTAASGVFKDRVPAEDAEVGSG